MIDVHLELLMDVSQISQRLKKLHLELPKNPEDFSPSVLTNVLKLNKTIPSNAVIQSINTKSLKGGVHFRVCKADLSYSGRRPPNAPESVVIKQVNGEASMTTWHRLGLLLKSKFPTWNFGETIEELNYRLMGYLIELEFYETRAKQVKVPIPKCYFSYYDYYNVRFVMIMEDLCSCTNGEPDGFTPEQASALLLNLASLHSQFWQSSSFKGEKKLWSYGGYWLGDKEMTHEKSISECLSLAVTKFPIISQEFPEFKSFGINLAKEMDLITTAVHTREPRTLIHGDYKISNLLIDMNQTPIRPYTIDWQWMGKGSCATDVAYFMYTSLSLNDPSWNFANDSSEKDQQFPHYTTHEMQFIRSYFEALKKKNSDIADYTFEDFEQQYALNVIYFVVFCIREKWSVLSPSDMKHFKANNIDGLHLRSEAHMLQLLKRASVLLEHINWKSVQLKGSRKWKNKL